MMARSKKQPPPSKRLGDGENVGNTGKPCLPPSAPSCKQDALSNRLPILAAEINEAHVLAMQHIGAAVANAIKAGELLREAKTTVPHGEWLPWLDANVMFSPRTAQSYMRVARLASPEIRSSAAQFSLRHVLVAIARRREEEFNDNLAAWLERERGRALPADVADWTVNDARECAASIREFFEILHLHGMCDGLDGCCTICGDDWCRQHPEEALRLYGEEGMPEDMTPAAEATP